MKTYLKSIVLGFIFIGLFASCDKVENPFPAKYQTELDTTLYPGLWNDYLANEVPDFTTITASPLRNVIVEDFTGHNCSNCPQAASVAHSLHEGNPDRVFVASIHSSPQGMSAFQATTSNYTIDFTNSSGLEFGEYFGNLANSGFSGNPSGSVNRKFLNNYFFSQGAWPSITNNILGTALKVAIKSKINYYPSTKGAFLHTEVEVLDNTLTNDLGMIVYLIEDSIVGPQNVSSTLTPNYVHRDVHRKNISGQTWGRLLTPALKNANGKYYLDYSFEVPNQLAPTGQTGTYNAENMHVLVYVYDKTTLEIYQVVKDKFVP